MKKEYAVVHQPGRRKVYLPRPFGKVVATPFDTASLAVTEAKRLEKENARSSQSGS